MGSFEPIDTQGYGDIEIGTFLEDARDVREDSLLNLPVGHDVNGFELVVLVESTSDFGKILTGKRLAPCQNQDSQTAAEGFRDLLNLVSFHLQFLAWAVIQFLSKEAMSATHVANGSHKNVQQHWG